MPIRIVRVENEAAPIEGGDNRDLPSWKMSAMAKPSNCS